MRGRQAWTFAAALAAAATTAVGCAHEHAVMTMNPPTPEYGGATAELADGRSIPVRAAETFDGPQWITVSTTYGIGPPGSIVDAKQIVAYRQTSRSRGLFEGMGIGFLGGALLGAGIGLWSGDDRCTGACWF